VWCRTAPEKILDVRVEGGFRSRICDGVLHAGGMGYGTENNWTRATAASRPSIRLSIGMPVFRTWPMKTK